MASKFKFKKYSRYDEARAARGVDNVVIDERDQKRGVFVVSLFDDSSKYTQIALETAARENAEALKACKDQEAREVLLFVTAFLHDWRDVLGADDKPVPFSREDAIDLLMDDPWLFKKLKDFSSNVLNYQADPRATKDEEAGN